jgi:hypothetical protein
MISVEGLGGLVRRALRGWSEDRAQMKSRNPLVTIAIGSSVARRIRLWGVITSKGRRLGKLPPQNGDWDRLHKADRDLPSSVFASSSGT